jgi:DNA modification methylase
MSAAGPCIFHVAWLVAIAAATGIMSSFPPLRLGDEMTIINGNSYDELKKLSDESVDCVITSPPYYGLRSYKGAETVWGGDSNCEHNFEIKNHYTQGQSDKATTASPIKGLEKKWEEGFCLQCGAWKGQLGLEPIYRMYLDHLLMITAELKRILKNTGTLFWNMGDSYAGKMGKRSGWNDNELTYTREEALENGTSIHLNADYGNIQDKSLMMLPERFAIEMIDQGWTLRNKIIWYKRNGMPSSVRDRFSNKWEYVFFFVKSKKYYFDLDAVRKPLADPDRMARAVSGKRYSQQEAIDSFFGNPHNGINKPRPNIKKILLPEDKMTLYIPEVMHPSEVGYKFGTDEKKYVGNRPESNIKHDLAVNRKGSYDDPLHTKPYNSKGANPGDVINTPALRHKSWYSNAGHEYTHERKYDIDADGGDFMDIPTRSHKFAHFAVYPTTLIEPMIKAGCPKGGTVLDPFAGSGTTGVVAQKLGRSAILIEISPDYVEIIKQRLSIERNEVEKVKQ